MTGGYSLRRRLLAVVLTVVALGWAAVAGLAFRSAHDQADRLFDAQLRQVAETLAAIVAGGEARHVAHELDEHAERYDLPVVYQVWRLEEEVRQRAGGRDRRDDAPHRGLLVRSPSAPESALADEAGFSQRPFGGRTWRFYVVDHDGYRVIAGQDHGERYRAAAALAWHLAWPIMIGLPLMAGGLWWGVGRALAPVGRVATRVAALVPGRREPLGSQEALPAEVGPLTTAIDGLIAQVAEALDKERRFTADAAHELRTPLAAIKVQAQVALRTGAADTRERALDQVLAGVDRMTRLVEQLLTLARLDPAAPKTGFTLLGLSDVGEGVCAELAPAALARGQSIELLRGPGEIRGRRDWLEILLRNLVGNAMAHTGAGSRIQVATGAGPEGVWLAVRDDGPGIPVAVRNTLRARFARGADLTSEGSGLGLSIAESIAEVHGGRLELEDGLPNGSGGHGLAVVIRWPPTYEGAGAATGSA